jgi:hypothetical protein
VIRGHLPDRDDGVMDQRVPSHGPARAVAGEISAGELKVLCYLPVNLSRREIAAELSASVNTVRDPPARRHAAAAPRRPDPGAVAGQEPHVLHQHPPIPAALPIRHDGRPQIPVPVSPGAAPPRRAGRVLRWRTDSPESKGIHDHDHH